jgi:hypothetical protein
MSVIRFVEAPHVSGDLCRKRMELLADGLYGRLNDILWRGARCRRSSQPFEEVAARKIGIV